MINFNSDRNSLTNDSEKRIFIKLDNEGDNYIVTRKRAFQSNVTLSEENFYKAFNFSYNMSFGKSVHIVTIDQVEHIIEKMVKYSLMHFKVN